MVSRLEALYRTNFRTTEQTDSWLGIKRDEADKERKKNDSKEEESSDEFGEDDARLSIQSLYNFLKTLLQQQNPASTTSAPAAPETPPPNPLNPATRAASAYQSTAQHAAPHGLDTTQKTQQEPGAEDTPQLSTAEIEKIQRLLGNLETLSARGVVDISLIPADSFLDSLIAGVRAAMD